MMRVLPAASPITSTSRAAPPRTRCGTRTLTVRLPDARLSLLGGT